MTTQSALKQRRIEQLPDPPREPDMVQRKTFNSIDSTLLAYFTGSDDVLITGEIYLILKVGDPVKLAPDFIFARPIIDPERVIRRNGYVISEVGRPPDLVLEVASRSTGRRDYAEKPEGYAALGVGEYWRFDPSGGEYHDAPLAGDLLVDGEYRPLEIVTEPDGRHWGYSEALGLELWWDNGEIRFRDPAAGRFLPTITETVEARLAAEAARDFAEARAEAERVARDFAEAQAEAERVARDFAEARAEAEHVARDFEQERADAERAARALAEERAQAAERRAAEIEVELRRLRGE